MKRKSQKWGLRGGAAWLEILSEIDASKDNQYNEK